MKNLQRWWRVAAATLVTAFTLSALVPGAALAGTTGTIAGVVTDAQSGAPIANVRVTAVSGSQTESTTTNASGFYSLQALSPDTYTVSFQLQGYTPLDQPGITVQQDFVFKLDGKLTKELKTIAIVHSRAAGNLVKPYEGTDVYNVSGQQLNAATGGDKLHHTIYEYLDTVPGVTPIGGGFPSEPSIRGGYDVDNGYELDGIPITERMTGYFTTNLTDLGIGNVEVFTGGLSAQNAGNGVGVINSVMKNGTYPGFGNFSVGLTTPEFNHFARAEYGGATPDHRMSWYFGLDAANSQNDFNNGQVSFGLTTTGISSGNPGYIETRDFVGNFHYRPGQKDDIQLLYQNSLFNDAVNYGLYSGTAAAPLLMLQPCPGAAASPTTRSGATGGTAPDGQNCPLGLYFAPLNNGEGNFLGHYSGIGKVQWNHVLSSTSSVALRLAENFNQYIFDQKLTDPNNPLYGSPGPAGCPAYPYAPGSPLMAGTKGSECTMDLGDYYQNRYGNDYYAQLDYTYTPNENTTFKAGAGQEYDNMVRDVRYLNHFNSPGNPFQPCGGATFSYSCQNSFTDIPMHVPYVYAQASVNVHKFTFQPGLRYSRALYGIPAQPTLTGPFQPNGIPGGTASVGFLAPSFLGTYRFGLNDVLRYSYSTTGQFIGTEFVYRLGSPTYNPFYIHKDAFGNPYTSSIKPQVNTSFDMQWEHQFNNSTSLKIGPYYRFSNNYLASFSPLISPPGAPPKYGPPELSNNLKIRSFGIEAGLSHEDNRPVGASYWLSASLNNYWTQVSFYGQVAFVNFPINSYFTAHNILVRSPYVPPFAATLTADLHDNGFHLIPNAYYTFGNFYRTGACAPAGVTIGQSTQGGACGSAPVMLPELQGMGYWKLNVTLAKDIGKSWIAGIRVINATNNEHDWTGSTIPCYNPQDPNAAPGVGTGCFGFSNSTPGNSSGFSGPANTYVYQPLTQNPRAYEFFLNYKM
ncbi:MAG TPA: carboxypeptidase regulatory-like domain-containing protein [Candidatus Baltobacteraceae bacterium]|nr:carboxypeptidase regulatory-like domain-containing protein [Candidatus Baltobacteraceae bacterium]